MDNVVSLNAEDNTYSDIQFFLDGQETRNTVKTYAANIKRFIEWKFKDIQPVDLQPFHFNNLTYTDMEKYRNYLRRKYSGNTVNGHLSTLYSLFTRLNQIERNGKYVYDIKVERLKVKSARLTDEESYGDVTWEEVDSWIDHLRNSNQSNKERKAVFLHTARVTGFRAQALADLTYKDLRRQDNVWRVKSKVKGKVKYISLKDEDAELIFNLQKDKNNKDEKVFFSKKTMERLMEHIKEVFRIPEERRISLHSLRYLSGWEVYLATGNDVLATQEHLAHSSIETTHRYLKNREQALVQPTLYIKGDMSKSAVDELEKDDWQKLFGKLSRSAKYEIINKAKDMGLLTE